MITTRRAIEIIKDLASKALIIPPWTWVGTIEPRRPEQGEFVNIPASAVQSFVEDYYHRTFGSFLVEYGWRSSERGEIQVRINRESRSGLR